jgi:hypothetical protein
LFETQVKIDPAIYRMVPNLRIGHTNFTCPNCGQLESYSEGDFLYTSTQADELGRYGRQVEAKNILLVRPTDPILSQSVPWVQPLTEALIQAVRKSGNWSSVTHRQLEEIVAELLHKFGYEVELTKRTRDGGRDVIAIGRSAIKDDKYLIECKHWAEKVGVSVVRELIGVGRIEPNSGLVIVSTSGFTSDARILASADQVRWELALKDKADLEAWIAKYATLRGWT